jgi:magnesium chelatase family protein
MNPCRCGHAGEPGFSCRQGTNCRERYTARISGPIFDRIDIRIGVPQVSAADLAQPPAVEGSAEVRGRVEAARSRQTRRYQAIAPDGFRTNAECPPALLERIAAPDAAGAGLLQDAASAFGLSARGYHRALRLARTLADLDGDEKVLSVHIAEALALRGAEMRGGAAAKEPGSERAIRAAHQLSAPAI